VARPRIDIDIDRVAELAGRGLTQAEICAVLGISDQTLLNRKRDNLDFLDAINRGRAQAAQEVANALYTKATVDKDLGAIIWYEKTRRGLSDRMQQHITVDVSKLSDDELRAIAES
jgi:DNA-binding CsgD family transcriptional regulator